MLRRRHLSTSVLSTWCVSRQTEGMNTKARRYHGYRCPRKIIGHAVWLYHWCCVSLRDIEDLMAERGIIVSYETIRQWCRSSDRRARVRRDGGMAAWAIRGIWVRSSSPSAGSVITCGVP
jgi:hypothetical protein